MPSPRPHHFLLPFSVMATVVFGFGCDGDRDDSPARPAGDVGSPEALEHSAPVADPGPVPAEPFDESEARRLVEAWLAAQNEGDFDAYGALYAQRFTGVKRSGDRVTRLDRAGWLDDRARMFRRPMQVSVDELAISELAGVVRVRMVQTWSSPTYRDVGPKSLVLVREGEALRIAREEMLRSTVAGEGVSAAGFEGFHFMLGVGTPHLLLVDGLDGEAADAAADGPLRLLARGDTVAAARPAPKAPADRRAIVGTAMRVFGPAGEVCTAEVEALEVVRRFVPHFGQLQVWNGAMGDPPESDAALARTVWESGEGTALVARLAEPACDGLFALPASEAAPRVVAPAPDPAVEARARARAETTPAYRRIQRAFRSEGGEGAWSASGEVDVTVRRFADDRGQLLVYEAVHAPCGPFAPSLLVPLEGEGLLPIVTPADLSFAAAVAAADLDGDGSLELLVREFPSTLTLLRRGRGGYERAAERSEPYFDCGC